MPLPGESFDGYLAYRAARAHMPGPFEISALGGATHAHYPQISFAGMDDEDRLQHVADELGIDVALLRERSHAEVEPGRRRFMGTMLDGRLIEKRSRRFSPASLVVSPHHRALWSVRCLPFCEDSWEVLADRCPEAYCGAVQRWRRSSGPDRCDQCGAPLSSARVDVVTEPDQPPLRMLSGLLHHDPARVAESLGGLPPAIAVMPPGGLVEVACALAVLHDPDVRGRSPRRPDFDGDRLRIIRAMAEAGRLLSDWPAAGERLAAERLAKRAGKFGDGNQGATLAFVSLAEGGRRDDAVVQAAGMLACALRGNAHAGLPIKEAVLGTGLKVSQMAALRRAGGVDTVFHLVQDRIVPLICGRSLARLRDRRADGIPIRGVAKALGITSNGVEQMLLAGTLALADDECVPPFPATTRVDAHSLQRLTSWLSRIGGVRPDPSWVSLAQTARGMGGDLKPWGTWLRWILDGSVAFGMVEGTEAVSHRILLPVRVVETMRTARLPQDTLGGKFHPLMSKADAASTLNLHLRHMREAFAAWPTSDDLSPCIPLDEIRAIAAHRIATSELAASLGWSSMGVVHGARRLGLQATPRGYDRQLALERFGLDRVQI